MICSIPMASDHTCPWPCWPLQDTNRQPEAPTVKMYQRYHTVMGVHTTEMLKWVRETIPGDDILIAH